MVTCYTVGTCNFFFLLSGAYVRPQHPVANLLYQPLQFPCHSMIIISIQLFLLLLHCHPLCCLWSLPFLQHYMHNFAHMHESIPKHAALFYRTRVTSCFCRITCNTFIGGHIHLVLAHCNVCKLHALRVACKIMFNIAQCILAFTQHCEHINFYVLLTKL